MIKRLLFSSSCCFILLGILFISSCKNESAETKSVNTTDQVLDEYNKAIASDSMNHNALYERANYYYNQEKFDASIDDLKKALKIDRTNYKYYHLLSDVYMDYFRSKDALQTMETCVHFIPQFIPSLLKLSETQLILKQYEESLMTVNKVLSLDDQNSEAFFMMGMNYRATDDKNRAINSFQMATELNPELIDAWMILGELFEERNNPLALQYYQAAIDLEPTNPITYHSKAFYLQNNNQVKEALEVYRKISTIDKNYEDAYLNAGILYFTLDSLPQAYEQFNILANIKPQNYLAYYYRGVTNQALNKIEAAKSDLNNCLNLNPEYSKARKALELISGD